MDPILFRLDEFLEFMREPHSAFQTSELNVTKPYQYGNTLTATITTTFRIFDGREFSLIYQKELILEEIREGTYSYFCADKHQYLSAKNCWVYYNHHSQSAYFRNSPTSIKMAKYFQNCLPQSVLDLISKHPNEEQVIFDYFREKYKDNSSVCNFISPLNKIKTKTLVANLSDNNNTLYWIKYDADRIKIPRICYAYERELYNREKEREAAKKTAEEIERNSFTFTPDQDQTFPDAAITAQETDSILFQNIDETDSPFFENTAVEFDPGIFDDVETFDQDAEDTPRKIRVLGNEHFSTGTDNFNNGLDTSEPDGKKITYETFDCFELDDIQTGPSKGNDAVKDHIETLRIKASLGAPYDTDEIQTKRTNILPELNIPTLELCKTTPVNTPTPVPEFDLGFIDCQAPHKFEFKLPFPHKLTGWLDRIRENLKVPRLFYISLTDTQDISFKGRLMAAANSGDAKLSLYQTLGGKWIGIQQKNLVPGQEITVACICQDKNEICNFFGYSESAKEIYYQSGIDASRYID
ncbi:hypothetical protein [Acinetobacter sp. YH12153]|uniref:hypothetical protein n=1 Tax=Acinetobacter sp. YH12153 TaxID=2601133 RepID=UPI0015D1B4C0|nr:hypothetical protein [Acinetobacter sp. YH12153]